MMPSGWTESKLGELFKKRSTSGLANLPTASVTQDRGLILRENLDRKMETKLEAHQHLLVKKGDIAYNMMRMWQGALGLAEFDCIVSPAYVVCEPKAITVCSKYFYYLFKSSNLIKKFKDSSRGLTEDRLRLYYDGFEKIKVRIPSSLQEQEKIAKILFAWDEAVEKLEKVIELEITFKENLIRKLMQDLEKVPSTEFKKLSKVCKKITAGGTPSTSKPEYWGGEIPWMNSGDINHKFVKSVEGRITQKGLDSSSTKIIPKHSVLMALAGQGKTRGTVAINEIDLCINQSLAALIVQDQIFYLYLYYNLDSRYDELRKLSTGDGGRGGLNLKIIGDVEIPLPPIETQKRIANAARALDLRIEILTSQKNKIQIQKQGLMQQLLTGKKRVKV